MLGSMGSVQLVQASFIIKSAGRGFCARQMSRKLEGSIDNLSKSALEPAGLMCERLDHRALSDVRATLCLSLRERRMSLGGGD